MPESMPIPEHTSSSSLATTDPPTSTVPRTAWTSIKAWWSHSNGPGGAEQSARAESDLIRSRLPSIFQPSPPVPPSAASAPSLATSSDLSKPKKDEIVARLSHVHISEPSSTYINTLEIGTVSKPTSSPEAARPKDERTVVLCHGCSFISFLFSLFCFSD